MTTNTEADAKRASAEKKVSIYKDVVPLTAGILSENTRASKEKMLATIHKSILGLDKQGQLRPINDLKLFLAQASQYGLNPFKKEIYATYIWDSSRGREELIPIVSIHGLRKLARQGGIYTHTGVAEVVYDEEDKTKIISATVPVFGQWDKSQAPVEVTRYTAMFEEFAKKNKDDELISNWKKMPQVMIIKCAEANAIRQGFDISGIFIEEEIARDVVIDGEEVIEHE